MIEKITLDMLTQDGVSVKTQKYVVVDDIEYPIGDPHRRSYVNSESGRAAVQDELPEAQASAILSVWGDTPTVDDGGAE